MNNWRTASESLSALKRGTLSRKTSPHFAQPGPVEGHGMAIIWNQNSSSISVNLKRKRLSGSYTDQVAVLNDSFVDGCI